jgi:hypothetical protein
VRTVRATAFARSHGFAISGYTPRSFQTDIRVYAADGSTIDSSRFLLSFSSSTGNPG